MLIKYKGTLANSGRGTVAKVIKDTTNSRGQCFACALEEVVNKRVNIIMIPITKTATETVRNRVDLKNSRGQITIGLFPESF